MKRSPWDVLGLTPGSSEEEIKKTYRKLIKENHPDINPNADPERIKEINEAYEFLIKNKNKNNYNEDIFKEFSFGFGFDDDFFGDVFSQVFGDPFFVRKSRQTTYHISISEHFTGKNCTLNYRKMDGNIERINFTIPPKVPNGSTIMTDHIITSEINGRKFKEKFSVRIIVTGNKEFEVKGNNLHTIKKINVFDLIKGTEIIMNSPEDPEGKTKIKVNIPEGTSFTTLKLKGKGLYSGSYNNDTFYRRGDIYINVVPDIPALRNAKNREEVEKLLEKLRNEFGN